MSISLSPDNGPIFLTPNDPLIEGAYAIERRMKAQAEQDAVTADRLYASAKLAAEIAANPSTPKES